MNYLAHAYLSFEQPGILLGNMISDFIKGKKKFNYPLNVQQGIQLHRMIDDFTDHHESTKAIKNIFKPIYGLYGNAFADIVYDHFLATDQNEFTDNSLLEFSQRTYTSLEQYKEIFPEKFAGMFPYMKQHNWLYNYRLRSGIERSFEGLTRRALYINDSAPAFRLFENAYEEMYKQYNLFFPLVKQFAREQLLLLGDSH